MAQRARAVFVDSSAWVALSHPRDQAHTRAVRTWPAVRARRGLVTTNLVLVESHSFLLARLGVGPALAFLDHVNRSRLVRVVWVDAELTEAAVEGWLRRFRDKDFTLADAASFEVMRREGIREAFAFDDDFERAGFALLG